MVARMRRHEDRAAELVGCIARDLCAVHHQGAITDDRAAALPGTVSSKHGLTGHRDVRIGLADRAA